MTFDEVIGVLNDPVAKSLIGSGNPARLAYIEWAKVHDFETRIPKAVEDLVKQKFA